MRNDKVVVDINHGWTKAMLRLSAFTVPIWAVSCQITVLMHDQPEGGFLSEFSDVSLLYTVSLLLIALVSTFVLANKIYIEKGKMRFPPFPFTCLLIAPEQIKSIKLIVNDQNLACQRLILTLSSLERLPLELRGLTNGRLSTILRALEKESPECAIEPGIESRAWSKGSARIDETGQKSVVISYRSHAKFDEFRKLVTTHEQYFWRTWLGFWTMTAVLSVPLYCFQIASSWSYDALRIYVLWRRIFIAVYSALGEIVSGPAMTYNSVAASPLAEALLIVSALVLAFLLLAALLQPNRLKLSRQGLSLRLEFMSIKFSELLVLWSSLKAVTLIKPHQSSTDESWFIGLKEKNGRLTQLKLSAFSSKEDRQLFLQCLNRWAPELAIEPDLIEALSPTQKHSYTELWLQSLSTPPKRNRLVSLSEGQSLQDGRFMINQQIGVGGQGVAYLAEDIAHPQEKIVLKEFVFPVYVDKQIRKQALQRFENEAQMLHNLDHPQIVQMKDYFVEDHRGYLVLEHIDGLSLRDIIEQSDPEQQYPVEWALDLSLQMCSMLEYLHGLTPPIVHRDFTPDNLILNNVGTLKLIDFNVAQQQESTKTGTVVGKHAYLPAEQFRGKPSAQSDIYAMGATIFFLLTGNDPEPLTVSKPADHRMEVNALFNDIVAKCTQIDAAKRYADVDQVKTDLLKLKTMQQETPKSVIEEEPLRLAINSKDQIEHEAVGRR